MVVCNNNLKKWVNHMTVNLNYSKNTVDSYVYDVTQFEKFLRVYSPDVSIANVSKQEVRAWILSRYNTGCDPKSAARGLSSIKNLHRFLIDEGIVKKSDILSMRRPKIARTLPRPLTVKQLNDVIETTQEVKKTDWIINRDKALIVLLYSTGLRISEALSLKKKDLNGDFLNIIGKGGKARIVPLLPAVKAVIIDYMKECPFTSEYIFVNRFGEKLHACTTQGLMRKIRKLINLPENITPHAIRHTCATHVMEQTGDLRSVQELLGHKSVCSTQVYADVTSRLLNKTYNKCHPLACKK